MENKSFKILAILLFILFVTYIGGATYILLDQDNQTQPPTEQTQFINNPVTSDSLNTLATSPDTSQKSPFPQQQPPMMPDTTMEKQK